MVVENRSAENYISLTVETFQCNEALPLDYSRKTNCDRMSPCADHCINKSSHADDYLHSMVRKQINMSIKQEPQPLDLSSKANETQPKKILDKEQENVKKVIKKEPIEDLKILQKGMSPLRIDCVSSESHIVDQRKHTRTKSHSPKAIHIVEAKHKQLPATVQGYSRTHSSIVKRQGINQRQHVKQSVPQRAPGINVSKLQDVQHGLKKTNGQYISTGLSGGTCKVVSQGKAYSDRMVTHGWNLFGSNSQRTRSRDSSPVPTVVQDLDIFNHGAITVSGGLRKTESTRPNSTPHLCHSSCSRNLSGSKSTNYSNHVLRNVSDLVRRRNELLIKSKERTKCLQNRQMHPNYTNLCESQGSLSVPFIVRNGSSTWSNAQYNNNYITQGGNITVASDAALTVQSRGLCGGTMVSCEPSAESMVAAIHAPLLIPNVGVSKFSFSPNYLTPFNVEERPEKKYFSQQFSRETESKIKEEPEATKDIKQMSCMFKDQGSNERKIIKKELNQESDVSTRSINKCVQDMSVSTGNLALLSNVCSLIKEKNNNNTEIRKSPLFPIRSVSPENDLPLKKRKICDVSDDDEQEKRLKTKNILSEDSVAQTNVQTNSNDHCQNNPQRATEPKHNANADRDTN